MNMKNIREVIESKESNRMRESIMFDRSNRLNFFDSSTFSFLGVLGEISDPVEDGNLVSVLRRIDKYFSLPLEKREMPQNTYFELCSQLSQFSSFIAKNAGKKLYSDMPVYINS